MSTLQDSDLFIVDRNGTNYQLPNSQMSTLQDTDLFVVERAGVNYKVEAKDVGGGGSPTGTIDTPVAVLTPLNGAGTNAGEPYQPLSTAITAVGAGGSVVYSTDTIASVTDTSYSIGITATGSNDLTRFLDVNLGTGYLDGSSDGTRYATFTGDPIKVKAGDVITIQGVRQQSSHGLAIRLTDFNAQTSTPAIDNSTWAIGAWNDLSAYRSTAPYTIDGDYFLTGFMVTNTGSDSGVGGLYINGEKLIANFEADTVLTFPTNNNFDKFEVGDVAQTDPGQVTLDVNQTNNFDNPENAFDGDVNTYAEMNNFSNAFLYFDIASGVTRISCTVENTNAAAQNLRIQSGVNTYTNDGTWVVANGYVTNANSIAIPANSGKVTVVFEPPTGANTARYYQENGLANLRIYSTGDGSASEVKITAINAAGPTISVDGGSWLAADGSGDQGDGRYMPDQEWSSIGTVTGGAFQNLDAAFNGSLSAPFAAPNGATTDLTYTFPEVIPGTLVEIYVNVSVSSKDFKVNGRDATNKTTGDPTNAYCDVSDLCTPEGGLKSFTIGYQPSVAQESIGAIRIDGKVLVSASIPGGPGATDISKSVTAEASLTFTNDTELANMVGPLTMVDENREVKTPVTSTITSVSNNSIPQPSYVFTKDPSREAEWSNLGLASDNNVLTGASIPEIVAYQTVVSVEATFGTPINIASAGSVAFGSYISPTYSSITTEIIVNGVSIFNGNYTAYLAAGGRVFNQGMDSYNYLLEIDVILATAGVTDINTFKYIVRGNENTNGDRGAFNGIFTREVSLEADPSLDDWYLERSDVILTFEEPNPDLKFFQPGDDVGTASGYSTVYYTGNGASQSINCGFKPDFVWIKSDSHASNHALYDSLRGPNKEIRSDVTTQQLTFTDSLNSFDPKGFTLGTDAGNGDVNLAGRTYEAWCFRAGGASVTNNEGTLESQVNSNGYFSIIRYTGAQYQTVGHGLSAQPRLLIVKKLSGDDTWPAWWAGFNTADNSDYMHLNSSGGRGYAGSGNFWNGVAPTDKVFSIGDSGGTAQPSQQYVTYAWTNEPGKVSVEGYSGAGGTKTITCGFKPAFVMIKRTNGSANWAIISKSSKYMWANEANSLMDGMDYRVKFTDTGFTVEGDGVNNSGGSFLYLAVAGGDPIEVIGVDVENNKMVVDGGEWSDGKVTGFKPTTYSGNGSTQSITGVGFSPDLVWIKSRTGYPHKLFDTVRGPQKYIESDLPQAETLGTTALSSFDSNGFTIGSLADINYSGDGFIAWCWDASDTTVTNNDGTIESQVRSNGNFSVITYVGDGNEMSVGHGLSSTPKLILTKNRSRGDSDWLAYHHSLGSNQSVYLNTSGEAGNTTYNGAGPDANVFRSAGGYYQNNFLNDEYVAYAWAETPGVSSFGSYPGNSSAEGIAVDCGFKPAFVMVKASSTSGNWNMFSYPVSANNITTGRLWANTSDPENSDNDKLEFLDNGFRVLNAGVDINGSGITYIYAAFAGASTGETQVTGQPLVAVANDVEYLDGNTLGVSGVSGTWLTGLNAQGAEVTASAPSPESIQYTSANGDPLTTAFTGTDATLTTRTWTWQVSNAVTGPWSDFATRIDVPGQDGAVPLADRPTLEPNKFYQVKVRYDSNNAEYVESTFNTFKTGDN